MNDNKEPQGNPWIKSALILAGVFLALLMFVTLFDSKSVAQKGTTMAYSEFRAKVVGDNVKEVAIGPDRISGILKNDERFTSFAVPDPQLTALLDAHNVKYSGQPEEGISFWQALLYQSLPFVLILGIAFFVLRQMQKGGGAGGAMGFGKSKAKLLTEKSGRVTFDDVAGIDEAREELQEIVEFLKDPSKVRAAGRQDPKGALLVGSPGTGKTPARPRHRRRSGGKTLLARAIAGEAGVPFFTISGSDFVEMFVGVGASRGPATCSSRPKECALHRLHRRDRRGRPPSRRGSRQRKRRARADAEPAAGRDGRLRSQ